MTKKRFVGLFQGDMLVSVKDTQTNERVNIIQIITLANILYEENEHLKQTNQKIYELISDYVNTHHSTSTMRLLKKIKKELKSE